jgi:hypothetical protein
MQEIVDFVNQTIPLCRYCKSMDDKIAGSWLRTENKIEEWT